MSLPLPLSPATPSLTPFPARSEVPEVSQPSLATRTVRAGLETDIAHGAVIPPIHLSSNYTFEDLGQPRRYDYTRSGNPTRDLLAEALAELEGGSSAAVTSSGMSAVHVVLQLLDHDDRVVAPHDCYGGCHRLLTALARRSQLRVDFVDFQDRRALVEALSSDVALVWVETPSNPLLRLTDIAAVVELADQLSSRPLVVVDNTFLSPIAQRPLELGADVVVHSTTKYLNGHSDVVGGAVISRSPELGEQLAWWANCLGLTGAPFDSYLTLRGLRTLHARFRIHQESTERLANLLDSHRVVAQTYFPGLPSHPDHGLAKSQQHGFGAIVSFELAGGLEVVRAFVNGLRCFSLAESLGGVESLVAHPCTMTHASMEPEARQRAGLTDSLLRLSVGIEAIEDLEADLVAALERAAALQDASSEARRDLEEVASCAC